MGGSLLHLLKLWLVLLLLPAAASATGVSAEASPGVSTPGARRLKLLGKLTAWYKMHIKGMHNSMQYSCAKHVLTINNRT